MARVVALGRSVSVSPCVRREVHVILHVLHHHSRTIGGTWTSQLPPYLVVAANESCDEVGMIDAADRRL